ncbi:hypothetical protein SAMN05421807_105243 [Virgibacillus chiguensis]|uniref:Lipoprotein n=1 Tax=Virgibacillus chiguensis TaxID=411959 RepID=A0A1M5RQH5_9BACI|nr:hypothetical protein SAMN05421807_105243 [Virgibacillus chiguensis]
MKREGIIFISIFLIAFSLLAGCNDTTASESLRKTFKVRGSHSCCESSFLITFRFRKKPLA